MRRNGFGRRLALLGLLALPLSNSQSTAAWQSGLSGEAEIARGRILIKFKAGVSEADKNQVITGSNAHVEREITPLGVRVLQLPDGANETAVMQALARRAEVEFLEPDYLYAPTAVPNDPWYADAITPQWHLPRIDAPAAWDTTAGSGTVIIAVIDTGVFGTHADLSAKMVAGWNIYDDNSDTSDITGHGTLVAGTAAAESNNALGIASVAWQCKIMPIRVTDSGGMALGSNIAAGLVWAADNGARVANLSFEMFDSEVVTSAAEYFESRGGVTVVSAGNSGAFNAAPDNPYFLKVSATDKNDLVPTWSVTGNCIDLAAPGVSIVTTNRTGTYSSASGTSNSAPLVAGVAALILSVNPSLLPQEVQDIIMRSADDLGEPGWDPSYGWGRLNAGRAVEMAANFGDPPPGDATPPSVGFGAPSRGAMVAGTINVDANAADNIGVTSVTMSIDGIEKQTDSSSPFSFTWNTASTTNGSHTLRLTASDAAGNTAFAEIPVTVDNAAPTASFTSPSSGETVSGTVSVQVNAGDNNGIASVSLSVDGMLLGMDTSSPYLFDWNTTTVGDGAHTLTTTVRDLAGNTDTAQRSVNVDNAGPPGDTTPPTISITSPADGATVSGTTVSVKVVGSDNVGLVRVELHVDGELKSASVSSPFTTKWNARKAAKGPHALRCSAYDAAGNVGYSQTITVYR